MTGESILHVAIVDDWEASRNFGEYEVSTRGKPFYDEGYIRATTTEFLPSVLANHYGDLSLPMIVLVISIDALIAANIEVTWHTPTGELSTQSDPEASPRINAALPMDSTTVVAELPVVRIDGSLTVPGL
jgi:uncharacterized protein (DUF952 family)